ncbi:hypothetical protein [Streptomyces sp. NPDC020983]|uniref:hypothetical protein n=1 Tax=Streptomyces sp. NPDC020983 TaxID=3365106 RepID=UPI0037B54AE1
MLTTTLCAALSAGGLGIAVMTAYRRRFLAAARIAAVSLVPVGLALAGLVTLGRKIGTATAHWAADLVFKPTVWMGFGVLAVAALLYGVTRLISARVPEGGGAAGRGPAAVRGGPEAPAIAADRPAASGRRSRGADGGLSEFADVEEILKRRGI